MRDDLAFPNTVFRWLDLCREKFDFKSNSFTLTTGEAKECHSLWKSLVEDLMWSPGTLLYLPNKAERKAAQMLTDRLWKTEDAKELIGEITNDKYPNVPKYIIRGYIKKAKMLKPHFTSISPKNTSFYLCFKKSMQSWLHGQYNAAPVLCCSLLENILKEKLLSVNEYYIQYLPDYNQYSMKSFINDASSMRFLNAQETKVAHTINDVRNNAIHGYQSISQEQSYKVIMNTKMLVEKLLRA